MQDTRPRFIVLDGIDGCGKSTQAARLVALLRARGRQVQHVREPGSTAAGERVRQLLLDPAVVLAPASEALLFCAARRQMLDEVIRPALAGGQDVVCERFHSSTFAYQGVAGGLDEQALVALLLGWAGDPAPDRYVLLDLDPELAGLRRGAHDRFEARGLEFQRRVAEGFRRWKARVPNAVLVPAAGTIDEVAARVQEALQRAG
jgi:dTMP kinase